MAGHPARLETKDQEPAMSVTTTGLTKAAGVAAAAAGAIFIGVQIGHPQLDLTTITSTDVFVRDCGKILMSVLALAGITGMYLSQVRRNGVFGLVGYLVFAANYLAIMCTTYIAAFVAPTLAKTDPGYVKDVIAMSTGRGAVTGDLGALAFSWGKVQAVLYLSGCLLFGIALFRAGVLARWAAALLAVSGFASAALSLMPDAFYRLLAFPNGIAMIGLGVSLWMSQRNVSSVASNVGTTASPAVVPAARVEPSTVR
jgi:hypothetical protein